MFKKIGNGLITFIGLVIILKYVVGFLGWEFNFNVEAIQKVEITSSQLKYFPNSNIEGLLNSFMEEQHQKNWLQNSAKKLNVTPQQLSDSISINYYQKDDSKNWTVEVISTLSDNKNFKVAQKVKQALSNYVGRVVQHANKPLKRD